ncbi:MAG: hypothetical protein EXQ84_05565 [Rhodospirillaceae bacterium]|nr:hypothetical protein [Rhodospirillaceae bacterium]
MIGLIFRIVVAALVLAGLLIFFAYAFIAALIVTPFILLFFYLLGHRANVQWWTVRREEYRGHRSAPAIDHDPDDLPKKPD